MVPHVVRNKREEMGLLVILPGPGLVVLATSTTIFRGVGRVLLDLPVMAIFSVASLCMTLSILHVGLVLQVLRQPVWECPAYPLVPWRPSHLADDLLGEVLPIQDEVVHVGGVAIVIGDFDSPEVVNLDGVSDVCSHYSTETDTTCGRGVRVHSPYIPLLHGVRSSWA